MIQIFYNLLVGKKAEPYPRSIGRSNTFPAVDNEMDELE